MFEFISGTICGGVLGFLGKEYIKSIFRVREKIHLNQKEYVFEELKKEKDLLNEYLGEILSFGETIINSDNKDTRNENAKKITEWTVKNSIQFPGEIKESLTYLNNYFGSLISDHGFNLLRSPEAIERKQKHIKNISQHKEEIENRINKF